MIFMAPDNQPPLVSVVQEAKDGKRPVLTFFNTAPKPIFSQPGVNGDTDRRYVDIGSKHLSLIQQEFTRLQNQDGITVSGIERKKEDIDLVQYVRFGAQRKTAGQQHKSQAYRAYFLIAPETIYPALQRINYVGNQRLASGSHLEYKFRYPQVINEKSPRHREIANRDNEALYIANPMDATVTLYADTQEELMGIFQSLIAECGWDEIEKTKVESCVGVNIRKPQKGSKRFELGGQEYKTLEFNAEPGFSENQSVVQ